MNLGRWLAAAVALVLSGPVVAEGVPNQDSLDLQDRLAVLLSMTEDTARTEDSVADLLVAAGLGDLPAAEMAAAILPAPPLPRLGDEVVIGQMNSRLALTPLVQAFGASGHTAVEVAQTDPERGAIVVRAGDATLDILRDHLGAPPGPVRLTRPLVILDGAALHLGPGETLELSRADGAFIVNFGHLEVTGAVIAGTTDENPAARTFRPFVLTTEAGTVDVRDADLRDLGFGSGEKFAGFVILRSLLQTADQPSRIETSRFDRIGSVIVAGDAGTVIRGNRFTDMTGAALAVQRSLETQVMSNLFVGAMRTNAIRIEGRSQGVVVAGNIVLGGDRAGIVVRGDAEAATIAGNIVWDRDGGGIALTDSDCSRVLGNLVIANDQKGIEVRSSGAVRLERNTVFSNHSAGIWISNQSPEAEVFLADNLVAYNGAGLAGANPATIRMERNDFSRQFQQLLAGDLALLTPAVARDMRGTAPIVLGDAVDGAAAPAATCGG